jgi:hypothetical protein
VSVAGREVCVEGRHEEKSEDGTRMVARQFVRRFVFFFLYFNTYESSCISIYECSIRKVILKPIFYSLTVKATSEIFSTNETYVTKKNWISRRLDKSLIN